MIRICLSLAITALAVAGTTQARADFRLEAHPTPPATPPLMAAPDASASPAVPDEREGKSGPAPSPFRVAHGFGDDVPLSFAARQIVPPTVTVRYGRGVDPNAAVSWKGEAPWNRVLAAAVRPLQLRLTTGASSVLISR